MKLINPQRRYCHVCGKWVFTIHGKPTDRRATYRPGQKHWHEHKMGYLCADHQHRASRR